jgi:uncharacterized damage-inducible protein DinB
MFRQLDDFLKAYEVLTQGTTKMLEALTDESLSQAVAPGHRTLGPLAWHVVATVPEMMGRTGLAVSSVSPEAPPPAAAAEIVAGYRAVTGELVAALKENWTDATLLETDDMYGEVWPRGLSLAALIDHEVHHRGQMTVLMRQAGLRVPGVYGPSQEEWSQFGMEAPPY